MMSNCNHTFLIRAALGNISLPDEMTEINFGDFLIKECPNRQILKEFTDENGDTEWDWEYPSNLDRNFPICDYYLEATIVRSADKGWAEAEDFLMWCLTRLRLVQKGQLWGALYKVIDSSSPGVISGIDNIRISSQRRPQVPPFPLTSKGLITNFKHQYAITEANCRNIKSSIAKFADISYKEFKMSIRRFHYSFDRDLPSDKLIDLFITLESLICTQSDSISYKLSLRTAQLIGENHDDKKSIFKFLKTAYSKRSTIVHGNRDAENWLLENTNLTSTNTTGENIEVLEHITRLVLTNILLSTKQDTIHPDNIDELLLLK
ncbi:HEPN domain-containing protein [Dehalococcoides mccartyi]|nr:HEPN domain-containing protein [Dehalococcoides mccartyi]